MDGWYKHLYEFGAGLQTRVLNARIDRRRPPEKLARNDSNFLPNKTTELGGGCRAVPKKSPKPGHVNTADPRTGPLHFFYSPPASCVDLFQDAEVISSHFFPLATVDYRREERASAVSSSEWPRREFGEQQEKRVQLPLLSSEVGGGEERHPRRLICD
ncbi:hypothetical protein GEV33_010493 [Tenebrio molitor]|uniref:Uncharacterized protein n=1 Tax=Tenebrio molitor TaxID=7067 RepID=A0A8J6HEN0_TENMO|nr:hypothetical protein GEV33_010493 [Tenebrio molitor]